MLSIDVKVNADDARRIISASQRVLNVIGTRGIDNLQWLCATDYYQAVIEAIGGSSSVSPPYSNRYDAWKSKYGWMGFPAPWKLKGDLVRNLGSFKYGSGYLGGVKPGAMDSGGKSWFGKGSKGPKGPSKSIEMYGRVEEFRRPVFGPVMDRYSKEGWVKRVDAFIQEINEAWR